MNLTRAEAEKIVRRVLGNHLGEEFPENLFVDSVDELLKEANSLEAIPEEPEGGH